jgi:hypothetical protein
MLTMEQLIPVINKLQVRSSRVFCSHIFHLATAFGRGRLSFVPVRRHVTALVFCCLQDVFHTVGQREVLQLPQIVVVGSQVLYLALSYS